MPNHTRPLTGISGRIALALVLATQMVSPALPAAASAPHQPPAAHDQPTPTPTPTPTEVATLAPTVTATSPAPTETPVVIATATPPPTPPPGSGLTFAFQVDPSGASAGDLVTYTAVITNATGQTIDGAAFTDDIPDGLVFQPPYSHGVEIDRQHNLVTAALPALAPGGSVTLSYAFRVQG
ncbi:MAG: DUF11 domain-containing protein, partial [Acidobacteria bacterium]|nr:DUF11 domain-containing protein [Acidobacteriota bacterium]